MSHYLCSRARCTSGLHGTLIPVIRFWAKGVKKLDCPPGHAELADMRLCIECAKIARVHDICTNKRWNDITSHIAAACAAPPDRDSIVLVYKAPENFALPSMRSV